MGSDIPPYVESSPYVVDIDWEEAELSVYNDEEGIMTISFGKDVPELEEGLSLIVVGTEHVTAVRRVMKIVIQMVQALHWRLNGHQWQIFFQIRAFH